MPTGTCRFPDHHGPSAGPPFGLLLAIAAGALVATHWHAIVVTLAVVAVLAVLGAGVLMLWHSHRSAPYDSAWSEPEELIQAELAANQQMIPATLAARVAELEAQLAGRRAIEAPQQHLHLHGLDDGQVAAIISRQAIEVNRDHD